MRKIAKAKLLLLLTMDTVLKILRHYIFLVPTGILSQSLIFTNDITATLVSLLILICCVYLISKDRKSGYVLVWLLTIVSILSVLSWGLYFFVKNILFAGFIVFNAFSLFVDGFIVYYLLEKEDKK